MTSAWSVIDGELEFFSPLINKASPTPQLEWLIADLGPSSLDLLGCMHLWWLVASQVCDIIQGFRVWCIILYKYCVAEYQINYIISSTSVVCYVSGWGMKSAGSLSAGFCLTIHHTLTWLTILYMHIFLQTKHHTDSTEYCRVPTIHFEMSVVWLCSFVFALSLLSSSLPPFLSPFFLLPSLSFLSPSQFNMSHTIRYLSFGDTYPGQHNPLDGYKQVSVEDLATGMYLPTFPYALCIAFGDFKPQKSLVKP